MLTQHRVNNMFIPELHMETGEMPSVSEDLNVNGQYKNEQLVAYQDMMTQSSSRGRGGRMDLAAGEVNPIKPGTEDSQR